LEESFLKGYMVSVVQCAYKDMKEMRNLKKRLEALKKGGVRTFMVCASVPTHATPGRPKALENRGGFLRLTKATKAKATNCRRVWVLKDRKDSNNAQKEILTTSF